MDWIFKHFKLSYYEIFKYLHFGTLKIFLKMLRARHILVTLFKTLYIFLAEI